MPAKRKTWSGSLFALANSCQDFSAIADVEGAWHLAGNPLTKLSEQELIDCGGGNQYGMGWIQGNGGVANIAHAPLANHSDKNLTGCRGITNCTDAASKAFATIDGLRTPASHNDTDILPMLADGPMAVSVDGLSRLIVTDRPAGVGASCESTTVSENTPRA